MIQSTLGREQRGTEEHRTSATRTPSLGSARDDDLNESLYRETYGALYGNQPTHPNRERRKKYNINLLATASAVILQIDRARTPVH